MTSSRSTPSLTSRRGQAARQSVEGLALLAAIVALMWVIEVINSLDGNALTNDAGIIPRSTDHAWAIFTSPFLHANFQHLIDNTVPFVFMGVIIALRGAGRLALVTLIVIVVGGLGTWLIAPAGTNTIGASGVVFGYATYLFARGLFDRSALEILTGVVVGAVWGEPCCRASCPTPASPGRPMCAAPSAASWPRGCWPAVTPDPAHPVTPAAATASAIRRRIARCTTRWTER